MATIRREPLDGQSSDDQMSDSETIRPQTSDRERRFEDRGLRFEGMEIV